MASLQVLVIDDEPAIRQLLGGLLSRNGYLVETAASGEEAAGKLAQGEFDAALCDIQLPGMDGIELLRRSRQDGCDTTFIMVTAFASVDTAIESLKAGAADYIVKPARNEEILHRLGQVEALRSLRSENRALRNFVAAGRDDLYRFNSPAMLETERLVSKVAPTDSTVLITGESGTGKSLIARQIHEFSLRRDGPYIPVNCSAVPELQFEAELFGQHRGSDAAAPGARKGLVLRADGGTLFLDEIGDLPAAMQSRLLQLIESRELRPLGGDATRRVDVRIVAATNRDLPALVAAGRFREDLYYRLAAFLVPLPPLRERREDLKGLIAFLLARMGTDGRAVQLDPVAEDMLLAYSWPGNVRELDNVLNRAYILADGGTVTPGDLPPDLAKAPSAAAGASIGDGGSLRAQVREIEMEIIRRVLAECGDDRRAAAQKLGIGLSSLYRKLDQADGES